VLGAAARVRSQEAAERDARCAGAATELVLDHLADEDDVAGREPDGGVGIVGPYVHLAVDDRVDCEAWPCREPNAAVTVNGRARERRAAGARAVQHVSENVHAERRLHMNSTNSSMDLAEPVRCPGCHVQ
jgi:hypothetical protein